MNDRNGFRPIERRDGYLPIEDYGLIGDGSTAGLVGRDGSLGWLCLPRFDSPPLFASILDRHRGGAFTLQPEGLAASRQYYVEDSGVLVTEMRTAEAMVRLTDTLTLRHDADLCEDLSAARGELLRRIEVLGGAVRLKVLIQPRGEVTAERADGAKLLRLRSRPELPLRLSASRELEALSSVIELGDGERLDLLLSWSPTAAAHHVGDADRLLRHTIDVWQRWATNIHYDGPRRDLVRRSSITLKLLDHFENGAIVAAPTASLPEEIGGERNWDYRYTWVRDAAFSVYALRRVGLRHEAHAFLKWVLDAAERNGAPKIMFSLDGGGIPEEREADELEGYRGSAPVRFGNGAADQKQNDVYGEIVDCAYQWAMGGERIDEKLWKRLEELIDKAGEVWHETDHGIWEVRNEGQIFTYSAAMCQVALDRGAKLAERFGHAAETKRWRETSAKIREAILTEGWSEKAQSIAQYLGGDVLDASALTLPMRRVIPADHPKMVATTKAVADHLGAGDGLIYRYLPSEAPDGLEGEEGAFLLCSFWLVDNLTYQNRLQEAHDLYDSLCDRANPLGLLPEQIDPSDGSFLGNFPQAFSHIGVVASGFSLGRQEKRLRDEV
jgi:alpha,alpha-trehalase